jgi:hypothetical protein
MCLGKRFLGVYKREGPLAACLRGHFKLVRQRHYTGCFGNNNGCMPVACALSLGNEDDSNSDVGNKSKRKRQ